MSKPTVFEANDSFTRLLVNNRCQLCQNMFDTEPLYHVHTPCYYKKHSITKPPTDQPIGDQKPFKCYISDCSESFATMNYLRRHVIYHFPKTFRCKLCEFEGFIKRDIERHLLIHSNTKDFHCDKCDKKFRYKHMLQEHERRHLGQRPFKCDWTGCDRAFVTHNGLKDHLKRHNKDTQLKCKFCEKQFVRNYELKLHMSRMHTDTPSPAHVMDKCVVKQEVINE